MAVKIRLKRLGKIRVPQYRIVVVDSRKKRDGKVIDASSTDANVLGSRAAFDWIGRHPRLRSSALQTVGAKGWDGFAIMVVD